MDTRFSLNIPSDPNNLIKVEKAIQDFSAEIGIGEDQLYGIMLTVSEAVTNAIVHANKSDPSKSVDITVDYNEPVLIIRVKDEGTGFDPSDIPDPTEPENLLKDSGRGLYLMRIYADDLKYNITGSGTETVLTYNLKK